MKRCYVRKILWLFFVCAALSPGNPVLAAGTAEAGIAPGAAETGNAPGAAEAGRDGVYDTIYDSIPLHEVEEMLQDMKDDGVEFSVQEYVDRVMEGDAELSVAGMGEYVKEYVADQMEKNKSVFIRLILYGVLSGIFLNFSTSLYEKQMGETGFQIIYFLVVTVLAGGFFSAFAVAGDVLRNIVEFMKVLVPSFSAALTWSSGSTTSMAFYQTALYTIAIAENLLANMFLPVVQIYFLISILNPLLGWRFTRFAALIRSFVRIGTKTLLAVMIGHQGIQGLIMPALDSVKRSSVFRATSSIPGVGNVMGGVADTVIGMGVLIKSAIGVGGLVAIILICTAPVIRLGIFTVMYKGLAAFSQPVTDRRIVSVFQSTADSGKLLLYMVFITAVMFLVTITIVMAATNIVL